MTVAEIIDTVLQCFAEYDPPCEVPEGVWAFSQSDIERLIAFTVELAKDNV